MIPEIQGYFSKAGLDKYIVHDTFKSLNKKHKHPIFPNSVQVLNTTTN